MITYTKQANNNDTIIRASTNKTGIQNKTKQQHKEKTQEERGGRTTRKPKHEGMGGGDKNKQNMQ